MCNKCKNSKNTCGCEDPIKSCCDIKLPTTCILYDGPKLSILDIPKGSNGNQIIREIDKKIKDVSPFEQEAATPTSYGIVGQSDRVDDVTMGNAYDLQSAIALINELKSKLNEKFRADRKSGQQYE